MEIDFFKNKNLLVLPASFPNESNSYYGGIFVKDQVEELKKYFNKVFVICPIVFTASITKEDRICHDYEFDNVHVYFPRLFHLPVSYFRKKQGLNYFNKINQVINENNVEFDLIHSHFSWISGYSGQLIKKRYGVPLIISVHEDPDWLIEEIESGKKEIIESWENADLIIRVNKKDLYLLNQFNENVSYLPNGFNGIFKKMNTSTCREKNNLPLNKKIILNIGSLVERKNHKVLIAAIAELLKKREDILTLIIGEGHLKPQLEKQIKKFNLSSYVKIIGAQRHEDIPSLINASDVFVLPSINESFGIVQIESMACGIPIISTINGGSKEFLTSEDYGMLINDPNDPKKLAETIDIVLEKKWNSKEIIKNVDKYSINKIILQMAKLYQKILENTNKIEDINE